jgi:hypothetical protein
MRWPSLQPVHRPGMSGKRGPLVLSLSKHALPLRRAQGERDRTFPGRDLRSRVSGTGGRRTELSKQGEREQEDPLVLSLSKHERNFRSRASGTGRPGEFSKQGERLSDDIARAALTPSSALSSAHPELVER